MPQSGKLPRSCTAGVRIALDVRVDDARRMRLDRGLQRFAQILCCVDSDAVDAGGAGHGGKVGVVRLVGIWLLEISDQLASFEIATLQPAHRGERVVVPDPPDGRTCILYRSGLAACV